METQDKGQDKSGIDEVAYFIKFLNDINEIEGWLTSGEALALYWLARKNSLGHIVEIGSWKGKSTCSLALGVRDSGKNTKVYAIDHFEGSEEHQKTGKLNTYQDFLKNINKLGVSGFIIPRLSSSMSAFKGWDGSPIGLLFIDGSHAYDDVRDDFLSWSKFVPIGGVVCLHDTMGTWAGPTAVVDQYLKNDKWKLITINSLTMAERLK